MGDMIKCHCGTYHYRNDPCPDEEGSGAKSELRMPPQKGPATLARLKAQMRSKQVNDEEIAP